MTRDLIAGWGLVAAGDAATPVSDLVAEWGLNWWEASFVETPGRTAWVEATEHLRFAATTEVITFEDGTERIRFAEVIT